MVFPIPDEKEYLDTVKRNKNSNRKRKKKSAAKKAKSDAIFKKKDRFIVTMSAWAEQFTAAATWQMKHQLAYWKAKAISLEYENKILHDIIRLNCNGDQPDCSKSSSEDEFVHYPVPKMNTNTPETETSESEPEPEESNEQEEDNWEVSEEFIDFLRKNAKYKEDAKRERQILKEKLAEHDKLEAGPSEPPQSKSEVMMKLYGTGWQKVAALEMSIQSQMIHKCDKNKPLLWPNIPFNC